MINVASTAALRGSVTNKRVAHSASKAGVIGATRQLAAEGAGHGIRVNAIRPGDDRHRGRAGADLRPGPPHAPDRRERAPGLVGTPADVVNVALFLASDKAAYVTGANIVVDGGWSAVLPGPAA